MNWKAIFGYVSADYRSWPTDLEAEKQVITLKVDASGTALRLVLENEYGIAPLEFSEITLCYQDQVYPIQVLRRNFISVRPGERIQTDPIALTFEAGSSFVITTQLAHPTTVTSGIVTYSDQEMQVNNFLDGQFESQDKRFRTRQENPMLHFVYGFQYLEAVTSAQTIHVFGDSLTQQGWLIDGLKQRLRDQGQAEFGLVNLGIGGNEVLVATHRPESDAYFRHGYAGLDRFERDVFGLNVPDTVLLFHGINDCLFGDAPAETIISGLTQYAAIVKSYGCRLIGCTLTPAGESEFYQDSFESKRQLVNEWIRHTALYQDILDLDALAYETDSPKVLKANLDRGDGLHYSQAGGHILAQGLSSEEINCLLGF